MNAPIVATLPAAAAPPRTEPAYKRILLKLSGEALMGEDPYGINREVIDRIVAEIGEVVRLGVQVAVVIGVDIVLKATKVDGVYTSDPRKDPGAKRYPTLTFDEAIVKNLKVMDATALALCRDQNMLLKVFSIFVPGALKRVVLGADEGTLVHC